MTTTLPARLLRLLSLLQSRREWSGGELADRLEVTGRTVRRDIDRLRELGYPVESTTGTAGGYRLASGKNLPPLLLDDDEAVAVAAGLLTAASGSVTGIEESSIRALAKLEQVLPTRLRGRVGALACATVPVVVRDGPQVDAGTLALIGAACRDHEVLSFDYEKRGGAAESRRVEPHSLVAVRGLWYLIAFDRDREDWRTFRVDRLIRPLATGRRFEPRALPAESPAAHIRRSIIDAPYRYSARVTVQAPAETVREHLHPLLPDRVAPIDEHSCTVRLGEDALPAITRRVLDLAVLDAAFTIDAPDDLRDHLRSRLGRLLDVLSG
ncbi:Predicted DNA-binding transcriptional regulator YafY, contains an HTH and WYL domains [Saccharopolyspora shandongensis]|uniref:Predicted DNA-binding transcriptional regulator YafY, contains an HTH and WYL domains n=1 Tax=Saccharopolyspora shandongensis TaxID=418495 RepID=A0A1H3EJT9_9PSEU|nr:YafY family protein [Saccharopolyspora shandongensis]SDX78857.1 Predicted DNA-binding transcriptional regulator YafY, contains an HTH and WYL domains [Saccharopolyspora shandongensis]